MRVWIAVFWAWLALATSAFAENRIALVIGNDRYDNLSEAQQLYNAVNDARAMKKALEQLNFQVDIGENLDRRQFVDKLAEFSTHLQPGDIAFFFYSGHGVSFNGANYMLPSDIPTPRSYGPAEEKRLAALAVAESDAIENIRASEARLTVMVLDACRDNPLALPGRRSLGDEKGLGPPPPSDGLLTIYSAGVGQTATDRGEGNSLFTGILVKELTTAGLGLRELAYKTQSEVAVLARSQGLSQVPGVYSQIIGGDVYLAGPPKAASASDETLAALIDNAKSADFLATLIASLPDGPLKERATARMAKLKNAQVANLTPPLPTKPERGYVLPEGATVEPRIDFQSGIPVAFSPDGRKIVAGAGGARLWDVSNGRELISLRGAGGDSVAFSPDGRTIALGGRGFTLWDVATPIVGLGIGSEPPPLFAGYSSSVSSVAFSPDGRIIASGSSDNDETIKFWDVASRRELRTIKGHAGEVSSVAFSPDGRMIASGSYDDATVKLWDVATGRELRTFKGHSDIITSVAFSPDGRVIASASRYDSVKLWDVATGRVLRTFAEHVSGLWSIAFSPDGRTIASGNEDNTVKLWDVASGRELRTLTGHSRRVHVAFSPAGDIIASSSEDGTTKLWEVKSGRLLVTLFGIDEDWAAFTRDGLFVTSGDPKKMFALMRGSESLPMDDFITANRRDSLAGEIARLQASNAR